MSLTVHIVWVLNLTRAPVPFFSQPQCRAVGRQWCFLTLPRRAFPHILSIERLSNSVIVHLYHQRLFWTQQVLLNRGTPSGTSHRVMLLLCRAETCVTVAEVKLLILGVTAAQQTLVKRIDRSREKGKSRKRMFAISNDMIVVWSVILLNNLEIWG